MALRPEIILHGRKLDDYDDVDDNDDYIELSIHSVIFYILFISLLRIVGGGVQLGPLGTSATNWPIVPARVMMMENLVE
jgi:hypothetical protein